MLFFDPKYFIGSALHRFIIFIHILQIIITRSTAILTPTKIIGNTTKSQSFLIGTKFSDLINTNVNVVIDPLRVIFEDFDQRNDTQSKARKTTVRPRFTRKNVSCIMTIHRKHCHTPYIMNRERITWDTRICFRWKCFDALSGPKNFSHIAREDTISNNSSNETYPKNSSGFAMRVENCWTGSIRNPIFIISKKGCTNERTMISSPNYSETLDEASSLGWLSVRLAGTSHVRLACAIRVCDVCDLRCAHITPPKCLDHHDDSHSMTIWSRREFLNSTCMALTNKITISNSVNTAKSGQVLLIILTMLFVTIMLPLNN